MVVATTDFADHSVEATDTGQERLVDPIDLGLNVFVVGHLAHAELAILVAAPDVYLVVCHLAVEPFAQRLGVRQHVVGAGVLCIVYDLAKILCLHPRALIALKSRLHT